MYLKKMENRRIMVRENSTGKLLADTKVLEAVSERNVVKIAANSVTDRKTAEVKVLIFGEDALYEFEGTIRAGVLLNMIEVALSKGREKESRAETRYPIDSDGVIEAIIYKDKKVFLRKPVWIMVQNVSVNGLLIKTYAESLQQGDQIQVLIDIKGKKLRKKYEIVRRQEKTSWDEEYGCRGID